MKGSAHEKFDVDRGSIDYFIFATIVILLS